MWTTGGFGVMTNGSTGSGDTSVIPSRVAGRAAITDATSIY